MQLKRRPRIILSAGHFNHTGGNAIEKQIVGPLTLATFRALERAGADVRLIQPIHEGRIVDYPGSLSKAAGRVLEFARNQWIADLYLELHGENNGRGDAGRGSFLVYPDWKITGGQDTDEEARDVLGPALSEAIEAATTIPPRPSLSERRTQVGQDGSRLGIFAVTVGQRANMIRAIFEVGSYSSPTDRRIMLAPTFAQLAGDALAGAICTFYDWPPTDTPIAAPPSWDRYRVKVAAGANIRKTPSATSAKLGALPRHAPVSGRMTERQADGYQWLKLATAGYIRADLLERDPNNA